MFLLYRLEDWFQQAGLFLEGFLIATGHCGSYNSRGRWVSRFQAGRRTRTICPGTGSIVRGKTLSMNPTGTI
jgi:hypothetical protein